LSNANYRDRTMPFLASSGWHNLCYREWGNARSQKVLICVHGLSRNRLDFDTIAEALCDHYRVISVDMPGRGLSDWMPNADDYNYPFFQSLLVSLIAVTGAKRVDWIGTSMGGILGMNLASKPGSLIRRMVMNDIGPFIGGEARAGNAGLADAAIPFSSEAEGIEFIARTRSAFGPFTEQAARKFGGDSLVQSAEGKWRVHYDPQITAGRGNRDDVVMWDVWNRISIPVLTLWGTESKLLTADTVERMRATGPRTKVFPVEGVGHCPGLTTDGEIDAIRAFFLD